MTTAKFEDSHYARWLNPALNPGVLGRRFAKKGGILAVDDILAPAVAGRVHAFLDQGMPDAWWTVVVSGPKGSTHHYDTPDNRPAIDEQLRVMRSTRVGRPEDGTYIPAYTFKRTFANHYATCRCVVCEFDGFLASPTFATFVRRMFGRALKPREVFASKYTVGDHLDPHSDAVPGREIAFVFNFSRDWDARYGGLLVFTDPPRRTYVPGYNRLMVFDVRGRGLPHFVSDVTAEAGPRKRLAISGWLGTD
jgi:hypothetical protein